MAAIYRDSGSSANDAVLVGYAATASRGLSALDLVVEDIAAFLNNDLKDIAYIYDVLVGDFIEHFLCPMRRAWVVM
jgi:hypothetical protein